MSYHPPEHLIRFDDVFGGEGKPNYAGLDEAGRLEALRDYVREIGLNPDRYEFLMPPQWRGWFLRRKESETPGDDTP